MGAQGPHEPMPSFSLGTIRWVGEPRSFGIDNLEQKALHSLVWLAMEVRIHRWWTSQNLAK